MSLRLDLGSRRVAATDLAIGLRVLADLLDAGLSAHRALSALQQFVGEPLLGAIPGIQSELRQGRSLAAALSSAAIGIPAIVVGVISAGESGAGLSIAVRRAAEIMEDSANFRSALQSALAYPALLVASTAASVTVLVVVVLPRFAAMLGGMGQQLPATTAAVLSAASVARAGFFPAIVASVISLFAWRIWVRTDEGQRQWHAALLAVPVIGELRLAAATGRSCGALSALIESGLPLRVALPLAARATGDAAIVPRFVAAQTLLARGVNLGRALSETSAVTATGVRLVRAGEESGRLAAMLGHAAKLERERAARVTRTGVRLLEPVLIIGFGAVVALVAGALLQAVYSIRPGA